MREEREGEESVDSGQRTGVIDANPAVKMQSASASPGIAIAPRAVVEVPMPESDDGSTGSGAAVHIADALMGTGDEEVTQVEENESWEDDDEEEVELVCMGLDLRLCSMTHLLKAEAELAKHEIGSGGVAAEFPTSAVTSNGPAPAQYDVIADLLHANMFKVYSDMLRSESLRLKKGLSAKFGYLPMMAVAALGALNAESFCERVLSCVKLVVSDLHVRLKAEEIRMLVMLRMNREFMEYMRKTYADTPLSEFKAADTYVRTRGGLETLDDDEDDD